MPKLKPNLKKRNHYISQFWIRQFADVKGQIYGWDGKNVRAVSSKSIMQEEWLYTAFSPDWVASDDIENNLSVLEGFSAPAFNAMMDPSHTMTGDEYTTFCLFLGLQACRHPDILRRGRALKDEIALAIAEVHECSPDEYIAGLMAKGCTEAEAKYAFNVFRCKTPEQLAKEVEEVWGMSPQDYRLPATEALKACLPIANRIAALNLTVVDGPTGTSFVLGDTPMLQTGLAGGFSIPISSTVALLFEQTAQKHVSIPRRTATLTEVQEINRSQYENARKLTIGSDPVVLSALT